MSSLCLSCCSTLSSRSEPQFTTKCCNRHVCDACLAANPRLSQYHPCLFCVGGVQVASGSESLPPEYTSPRVEQKKQEENTFVIGDDEGDEEENVSKPATDKEATREVVVGSERSLEPQRAPEQASLVTGPATNSKYWIQKRDTLQGIALRLRVNAWVLCQLNSLPPSALSTTPHLLHTRSFLLLPPGTHTSESLNVEAEQREDARRKERATKRFQSVTKVVDYGVARAYMELAQDDFATPHVAFKSEKGPGERLGRSREEVAVDAYLDDDEWEREQLRAGVVPRVLPFPYCQTAGTSGVKA